jgi:hypothetical protein
MIALMDREQLDALVFPFKTFPIPVLGADWSTTDRATDRAHLS